MSHSAAPAVPERTTWPASPAAERPSQTGDSPAARDDQGAPAVPPGGRGGVAFFAPSRTRWQTQYNVLVIQGLPPTPGAMSLLFKDFHPDPVQCPCYSRTFTQTQCNVLIIQRLPPQPGAMSLLFKDFHPDPVQCPYYSRTSTPTRCNVLVIQGLPPRPSVMSLLFKDFHPNLV